LLRISTSSLGLNLPIGSSQRSANSPCGLVGYQQICP
jgi:hypothetical protein